jgi:hypothetical protein
MKTLALSRTFQETVYYEIRGAKVWELDVLCYGHYNPGESATWDNPGEPPWPDILGLEVTGARREEFDGQSIEIFDASQLDWLSAIVNRRYWFGDIPEGELEGKVLEGME